VAASRSKFKWLSGLRVTMNQRKTSAFPTWSSRSSMVTYVARRVDIFTSTPPRVIVTNW
jgi:hypothetical protein